MSIEVSEETKLRLTEEARKQGISVEGLLDRLISEREAPIRLAGNGSIPKVPILHLGAMGPLHRRDIYDDVR